MIGWALDGGWLCSRFGGSFHSPEWVGSGENFMSSISFMSFINFVGFVSFMKFYKFYEFRSFMTVLSV